MSGRAVYEQDKLIKTESHSLMTSFLYQTKPNISTFLLPQFFKILIN